MDSEGFARKSQSVHVAALRPRQTRIGDAAAGRKDKLKPLVARQFQAEAEFLAELTPLLTEDELKSHRATVLKISERTVDIFDRVGGGLEALGPLLIGSQGTASVLTQPEFRDGVIDLMSQIQLADGSWMPGGQFSGMRRWTLSTANQATTMWTTLALASYDTPDPKKSASIQKAVAYQRQQTRIPIIANGWR